jgi:succinate dehydrogenase / fumarate reductase cytochrome b subunit
MYRPLSPHIFIYKPQLSSILSVFHRATGIMLALGLVLFILSLKFTWCHVAHFPIYFIAASLCTLCSPYTAVFVSLAVVVLSWSLFYHLSNGIRHLIWDFSDSQSLTQSRLCSSAALVLFLSFLLGGFLGFSSLQFLFLS